MKGRLKAIRVFLTGMLCGVIITAAVAFLLAIPANSDYWRWEIWKRGGAAWTFDKKGHLSWMWTVEPIPDTPKKKRVIVPSSQTNIRSEQL
jgi:gas vesicle protein